MPFFLKDHYPNVVIEKWDAELKDMLINKIHPYQKCFLGEEKEEKLEKQMFICGADRSKNSSK